ncbi:MAG: alkaline phosphatase family protein [Microthrixaceae bacterium]
MNILLVTIDQWRADSLGCAGHPCARTPNIDRLAARGARFTRHYAQAAPCGPSRASLLTGTYLHNHRVVDNGTPLDDRFTNLALELAAVGYRPTLFGYTDTTVDPRTVDDPDDPRLRTYEGVLPGFEVEVRLPESADAWLGWLGTKGYDVPDSVWDLYADRDRTGAAGRGPTWAPVRYSSEHTEAAFLVERFVEWHRGRLRTAPWFAHVTFLRPHPPLVAPAPFHDLIDPAEVPMPVRHADMTAEGAQHPMVAGAMFVDAVRAPESERDTRQLRATYWGMLAEVDEKIGWLLDHLGTTDGADTLVIVTSDHGEQLGDHWLMEKLGYFESSYHIPLVIAGPGVEAGAVIDEFTENVDLMPTILTAAGLTPPAQCDGMALQSFLAGGSPSTWRDAAHWEWDFRHPSVSDLFGVPLEGSNLAVLRDRHGKYVHFAGMPAAFYDLDSDPGELHNLAADPAARDRVLDYAQRLLSWRMSSDDQTLAHLSATPEGIVAVETKGSCNP